jgi:hypothetical protein
VDRYGSEAIVEGSETRDSHSLIAPALNLAPALNPNCEIDAIVQISLLGKLKMAIRARPHLRGVFDSVHARTSASDAWLGRRSGSDHCFAIVVSIARPMEPCIPAVPTASAGCACSR